MRYKDWNGTNAYTFFLTDHLGSTTLTVLPDGTQAGRMLYRAFGEQRFTSGTTPTDYRYTGQLAQADVGLYYYGARWYDPALGRFTQADTLIPQPGNPLDWDRYAYVRNSPVNYTDPSGHFTEDEIQHYFGVDSWDDVLKVFQEGGALEGRWGWLTVLQKAELGDEISINWDVDQLPYDHPDVDSSFKGKFKLDKSGRLIITGEGVHGPD